MSFDTSSLSERNDKAEVYQQVIIRLENVSVKSTAVAKPWLKPSITSI